jgi:hypothetical protein
MMKDDLHEFVSKLTTDDLIYLLYKDHFLYNTQKKMNV